MGQDISQPHLSRQQVLDAEHAMLQMEQVECPVKHHFAPGVYAREVFIPKGSLVTGRVHKFEQLNIMSSGRMSVLIDGFWRDVSAPFTIVSPAGTKRIAYAHEDTVWTTVHGTDETDLDVIEAKFTADSDSEYLAFCEQAKIGEG